MTGQENLDRKEPAYAEIQQHAHNATRHDAHRTAHTSLQLGSPDPRASNTVKHLVNKNKSKKLFQQQALGSIKNK